MYRLIKEPLIQFLVMGLTAFTVLKFLSPASLENDPQYTIEVTDDRLIGFLQAQNKRFQTDDDRVFVATMDDETRALLVAEYVRQEALYREAISLGLDQDDEIIRRRLIQKMEYLAEGFSQDEELNESDLRAFYELNQDRYKSDEVLSFSHIVFRKDLNPQAKLAAETFITQRPQNLERDTAGSFGDRPLYSRHYTDRDAQTINAHFGESFTSVLRGLPKQEWSGPIETEQGWHIVYLSGHRLESVRPFDDVIAEVLADYRLEQQRLRLNEGIEQILEQYHVEER